MEKLKKIYTRYRHGIPLLVYMIIYLSWFTWLEDTNKKNYRIIHVSLDDYIPFCEVFIIPYFLWFLYVAGVVIFLFLKNRQDFNRACTFLFTGMTVFLIVSTLWPNGHHLRPMVMPPRDNIFMRAVAFLWKMDTPTNLWPSIHVYNSMGAHFAIVYSADLRNKTGIKIVSCILALSIVLSTMFLKQHSVFDVVTGLALSAIMYMLVYRRDAMLEAKAKRQRKSAAF